jgi:ribosomal-protein-alanine N-acetyltransferase
LPFAQGVRRCSGTIRIGGVWWQAEGVAEVVIRPFRQGEAHAVASWAYEPPYDWYNGDPTHFEDYLAVAGDGHGYYAIVEGDQDEVIGFCCFGPEARVAGQEAVDGVLDIGGGVRPDRLSIGVATALFPVIIDFARATFRPTHFRTAIASFNERSLRLCRSAGFTVVRQFDGPGREFYELLRPA